MPLTFYCGSGSPYTWRVWLALEHKRIPYELKQMSFSEGDQKKPGYLAINPRGRVPAIVDDGFALYESAAILEYLDEKYPGEPRLFPGDAGQRARGAWCARRINISPRQWKSWSTTSRSPRRRNGRKSRSPKRAQ